MTDREESSVENHTTSMKGDDEESLSSFSDSSSLPGPIKGELSSQGKTHQRAVREAVVDNDNNSVDESDQSQISQPLSFNPNEKGTRKQKRCDYDSDSRSYEGLGFEYKRRHLPTTSRRDTLLPDKTRMVDFDQQANKKWGSRLLFETLDDSEIDSLVGLATRQTTPSSTLSTNIFHSPHQNNPLLSVSYDAPLPPSHIDYLKSRMRYHEDEDRRKGKNSGSKGTTRETSLDDSAAVAMGMYFEECITASLLPLAGLHVMRCQALEAMESAETEIGAMPEESFRNDQGENQRHGNHNHHTFKYILQRTAPHPLTGEMVKLDMKNQIRWQDESAFQEWTLPPEEAILKLIEQEVLPKDSPHQFVPGTSQFWASAQSNHIPNRRALDIQAWAQSYEVSPKVISANREIFDIFLPHNSANLDKE